MTWKVRAILPDLPAVVMSGYAAEDVAKRFAGVERDGSPCTPFAIRYLSAAVGSLLESVGQNS